MGDPAKFNTLESSLERAILAVSQVGITASDFQASSQPVLNQQIQNLISTMKGVDILRPQFDDVTVPMDVFEYIDSGKNPQLYTRDCLEKALAKRKEQQAKTDSLQMLHDNLLEDLQKAFPDQLQEYRIARNL